MGKGVLATIITFLTVVLFCSIEVKVAAAEQSSGFRAESRYVIYTGSTQNALYDSNGSQEGGWAKGAYNSDATLHNLCKFHWELTESEGKYTLTNVGTEVFNGYKDLIQPMEEYEGISQIADELSEKLREAEILYNSASLIPERMEVVELKEAIDALKDESAWKTADQLNRMLTSLKEKIEAYEQADINSFTVEARYSSNHIRINALKGVTAYNIYKSLTEDGEYQKLTSVTCHLAPFQPPVIQNISSKKAEKSGRKSRSVVSDSFRHHGLYSPWNSPGQNTGEGSLSPSRGSSQPKN